MYDFSSIISMLNSISAGVDPTTGEVFDRRDMYNNSELFRALKDLAAIAKGTKKPESKNLLNRPSGKIFDELKAWRLDKAREAGMPAYIIFSDKELWSIAEGDVCKKEELLLVNGISSNRYEEYADDIFEIISDYIE